MEGNGKERREKKGRGGKVKGREYGKGKQGVHFFPSQKFLRAPMILTLIHRHFSPILLQDKFLRLR